LPVAAGTNRPAWNERRVQLELQSYFSQRGATRWPSRAEFVRDGQGPLRWAVAEHGGRAHWAERFADDFLERRLRGLLAGRREWPTTAEWKRLGAVTLLVRLHRHPLGTAGWARRLDLPHPRARPRRGRYAETTRKDDSPAANLEWPRPSVQE